uniref:Uncharacterized protein n=1 Tax=Vitis vinifera TaxID=29760 RepID=F6I4R3_VITVI
MMRTKLHCHQLQMPPTADATIDYISSKNLKAMPDPKTQIIRKSVVGAGEGHEEP